MFSIHDFIMTTLDGMVGQYPDFQIQEYALNWYSKGKLTEEDLATVEQWIADYNKAQEEKETTEEQTDETTEEATE